MKRSLLSRHFNATVLAVPACALMLGAAQAGTTVGLNFQAWYYDSGSNPQTIGFGAGYQTTGFPVTAKAFGVDPENWSNTDPLPAQAAIISSSTLFGSTSSLSGGSNTFAGSLTLTATAPNSWQSGIGEQVHGWNPQTVAPGDDEVTWGYLDDGNAPGQAPSATVTGLAGKFPNGYVVQTFAANSGVRTFDNVDITDDVTTNVLAYATYVVVNPVNDGTDTEGTVGVSAQSSVFTSDAIYINPEPKTSNSRSVLCGFIITDQPVVSGKPVGGIFDIGATVSLNASAIGIPPITYQWYTNGVPVPGATSTNYTKTGATPADTAAYTLVASNAYGLGTSVVAQVTVLQAPVILVDLSSAVTNFLTLNEQFPIVAGGQQPLSYQWFKGVNPIPNATNSVLTLSNLQAGDAASYQVVVANSVGSATSHVAALTVLASQAPYEGFNYPDGSLTGQNGGIGWTGAWTMETNYNGDHSVFSPVTPWRGGLDELVSTGGGVALGANGSADFEDIRNLLTTVGGTNSGTLYMSFVCQVTNAGWGGVELVQDGVTELFLGSCWYFSPWGWGQRGAPDTTTPVAASTLALLVYRFDFTPTNTAVRLYVNPSELSSEPAAASATGNEPLISFDQVRIVTHNSGPNGFLDEIRLGGSWASVTPNVLRTDAPFTLQVVLGGLIRDTKPVGTPHPGYNRGSTWVPSLTDANTPAMTRTGVEGFWAGSGSQIVIPTNSDFNSPNGTISFWLLVTNVPLPAPGNEGAMLFDRRTTNGTVIVLHDDGSIFWQGQGGSQNAISTGYVVDGNWHSVAVTYGQTTNDTISIYIDGVLGSSTPVTNGWSWPLTQEIELGQSHDPYWMRLDGYMDDFRMYNRVLTAAEVGELYTNALVDTSALVVRYNFDSAIYGNSVVWPYGTLLSSPSLAPGATWTPVPGAVPPTQPFDTTKQPQLFFKAVGSR